MENNIGRREFLKRMGLGTGALFLAGPILSKAFAADWNAEKAVQFAVKTAMEQGAVYADASIGPCHITGQSMADKQILESSSLAKGRMLGMRICTPEGWRNLVLADTDQAHILQQLSDHLHAPRDQFQAGQHWISAEFDQGQILAKHSSDPGTASELGSKWLRYADRLPLPKSTAQVLFCDILLIK